MSDTAQTLEAAVLTGAEKAVGDLLSRLRLSAGTHEVTTVLDWLDQHGVLDAVDKAANAAPAVAEAPAETVPPAEATAGAEATPAPPTEPEASAPAATQPIEPTASAAADAAAAAASSGEAPKEPAAPEPNPLKQFLQTAVDALAQALEHL